VNRSPGYSFREQPWTDIRAFLGGMAAKSPDFRYLTDFVDSIVESGADEFLAGDTSMHDLLVALRPAGTKVGELIAIRAPSSLTHPPVGRVRIEHLSSTGRNDSIDRPPADAVRLFWRLVFEKYGLPEGPQEAG
jgi:hypothetical protein